MDNSSLHFGTELASILEEGAPPERLLQLRNAWFEFSQSRSLTLADMEDLHLFAMTLETKGLSEDALKLYSALIQDQSLHPFHLANFRYRAGFLLDQLGDGAQAERHYRAAAHQTDNILVAKHAQYQLACLLIRRQRPEDAVDLLAVLEQSPADPIVSATILARKALALLACRRQPEACDVAEKALHEITIGTANHETMQSLAILGFEMELSGETALAARLYSVVLAGEHTPEATRANMHLRLGILRDNQGKSREAITHYEASAASPACPPHLRAESLYRMADALFIAEDYAAATESLNELFQAPHLPPGERAASKLLAARSLFNQGLLKEAQLELEQARTTFFPPDGESLFRMETLLAEIFEAQADFAQAEQALGRAAAAVPGDPRLRSVALLAQSQLRKRAKRHPGGAR